MSDSLVHPFWVVAHGCNTVELVEEAIDAGANALEFDLSLDDSGEIFVVHQTQVAVGTPGLLVELGDDEVAFTGRPGSSSSFYERGTRLERFLTKLNEVAEEGAICLLWFDIKFRDERAGRLLAERVRERLKSNAAALFFSCSSLDGVGLSTTTPLPGGTLGGIGQILGFQTMLPRRGVGIDEERDATAVVDRLELAGFKRVGYGMGTTNIVVFNPLGTKGHFDAWRAAVRLRSLRGAPQFIGAWTVNDPELMANLVRVGVDAVVTDIDHVSDLATVVEESKLVRRAEQEDDPFALRPQALLRLMTADVELAGTDATIDIQVNGSEVGGSTLGSRLTISEGFPLPENERGREWQGQINPVGQPAQLTLRTRGGGIDGGWLLQEASVIWAGVEYVALHGQWIYEKKTVRLRLGSSRIVIDWTTGDKQLPSVPGRQGVQVEIEGSNSRLAFGVWRGQQLRASNSDSWRTGEWFASGTSEAFSIVGPSVGKVGVVRVTHLEGPAWDLRTLNVTTSAGKTAFAFNGVGIAGTATGTTM